MSVLSDCEHENGGAVMIANELLCFVHNKINVLPSDTIVQLCEKHYRCQDIETAKRKLFEVCPTEARYVQRKGHKKNTLNLDDIVKRFHELDPDADVIPLFVARDLTNLPPITFDSIDVTVLLTKLERLTDQVAMLQTDLEAQTTVTENIKGLYVNAVSRIHSLETYQHIANTDASHEKSVICPAYGRRSTTGEQ